MKRTQISTNAGILSIFGGFLSIYNDVMWVDFFTVFKGLTFGQIIVMSTPFVSGFIAICHDEET